MEPALQHIRTWISAVGASAGLADLDGNGRPDERCLVDPRDDSVTIAPTPERPDRFIQVIRPSRLTMTLGSPRLPRVAVRSTLISSSFAIGSTLTLAARRLCESPHLGLV